jgi:hypothetical protein
MLLQSGRHSSGAGALVGARLLGLAPKSKGTTALLRNVCAMVSGQDVSRSISLFRDDRYTEWQRAQPVPYFRIARYSGSASSRLRDWDARRSLRLFVSILLRQNAVFVLGKYLREQPCQKQPSTKTTTFRARQAKSGFSSVCARTKLLSLASIDRPQ